MKPKTTVDVWKNLPESRSVPDCFYEADKITNEMAEASQLAQKLHIELLESLNKCNEEMGKYWTKEEIEGAMNGKRN